MESQGVACNYTIAFSIHSPFCSQLDMSKVVDNFRVRVCCVSVRRVSMLAFSRGLAALTCAALLGVGATAYAAEPVHQAGEVIQVHLDQAKLLKVPDGTATLVVGNPLIADVSVQPGGTLVVTGKGYGNTNLVALDRSGSIMVVYRGVDRETYSCTPVCERRITLGDTQNYFAANLAQSGTLNAQAQGSGAPAAPSR
jgi:hypothetical protein